VRGTIAAVTLSVFFCATPLIVAFAQEEAGPPADLPTAPPLAEGAPSATRESATSRAVSIWSAPTSEENPPATASNGQLISAMQCTGSYCDNTSLGYENVSGVNHVSSQWTDYFSEEGTYWRICSGGSNFMTGISFRGSYGDNVSILCTNVTGKTKTSCRWMPYFSEEARYSYLEQGEYAAGLACRGSYCDNKSILACR